MSASWQFESIYIVEGHHLMNFINLSDFTALVIFIALCQNLYRVEDIEGAPIWLAKYSSVQAFIDAEMTTWKQS